MNQQAFLLHISPSHIDRVPEALTENQIIIGWAKAQGLLDTNLSREQFREIIRNTYYTGEDTLRRAGIGAGIMWRFIREMNKGDLVVVPYGSEFYIAEVDGPAIYDPTKVTDDTAYRRPVIWLNGKKPIRRDLAKPSLASRMKTRLTCVDASELLNEIKECLQITSSGQAPTPQTDRSTGIAAKIRGYLPSKVDCERVIEKLKHAKAIDKISEEDVLNSLEEELRSKDLSPKDNWRLITKLNFKIWYKN